MAAIWNLIRHRYFGVSATVAMLLLLPIIVISTQSPQRLSGIAEGATTIIFSPTSIESAPLERKYGQEFFLNALIDPGTNIISTVRLDINYDPKILKLSITNPVEINNSIFPNILERPSYSAGNVQMTLSVGKDLSKSISSRTKAVTLNFVPISKTLDASTIVSFGVNTSATNVEVNDLDKGNVVSTTAPAYIKIN
jgi:hypothetical protein